MATIEGTKQAIAQTERNVVSLAVADGKLLWQVEASGGRYAASSPVVDETNSTFSKWEAMAVMHSRLQKKEMNLNTTTLVQ